MSMAGVTADRCGKRCGARKKKKRKNKKRSWCRLRSTDFIHSFILSGGLEHVIGWYLRPWKVSKNKPKNQPTQTGDKTRIHMGINTD